MVAEDLPEVVLYFRNSFIEIQFSYHTARLFKVYISCLYIQHAELYSITPQKNPIPFSTHSHPPMRAPCRGRKRPKGAKKKIMLHFLLLCLK